MPIDANLNSFASLTHPCSGILIGNGASRAISSLFAYQSLFAVAQTHYVPNQLSSQATSLFTAMDTTNFEQVLSTLISARTVNTILGLDTATVDLTYQNIRQALIGAVHAIHIPWTKIPFETLQSVRVALRQYKFVYSTNYDLLVYWAIMQDPTGFVDYFFGSIFDVADTEIRTMTDTRFLFLHGALHLSRTIDGTLKRASGASGNILETFGDPTTSDPNALPLFISEGSSQSKLASIRSNDYLSFAYGEFARHSGGLAILGQSMDPLYDQHLIDALRGRSNRHLAIGIYRGARGDAEIMNEKTRWIMRFNGLAFTIDFFDSTSHPLGAASLLVS